MGGRLADGFADLLRSLWGSSYSVLSPTGLRELINEKWEQFAGYYQHDAQAGPSEGHRDPGTVGWWLASV